MFKKVKKLRLMGISGVRYFKGKPVPKFRRYPQYIKGTWAQYTVLTDKWNSQAIECLYKNDDNESGTIVMSYFINNDYPASWATIIIDGYDKDHYTAITDRFYTSPIHRKKKYIESLALIGYPIWCTFFNILPRLGPGYTQGTQAVALSGSSLIASATKKRFNLNRDKIEKIVKVGMTPGKLPEINMPAELVIYKDPIFPALFHSMSIWEPNDKKY